MEKLEKNEVKIVEVSKISPLSSQQCSSKTSLPISAFDWLSLRFHPVEYLVFYSIPHLGSSFFDKILIPKLKHSLSSTLQYFLLLSGKLVWPKDSPLPSILYVPNDGVSFTVVETDSDFDNYILPTMCQTKDMIQPFLPMIEVEASNSSVPVMAIQLTKFPNNKGFCIGFATHHVLFDGKSFTLFLKSWAHICKNLGQEDHQLLLPPQLTPSFERGANVVHNPFDFVPKDKSLKYISFGILPSNWIRGTFELTPTHIHKLKERVTNYYSTSSQDQEQQLHLSTFVVAYAYVLVCLIKAKQDECKKDVYLTLMADVRELLDPPVSNNYFGNCVTPLGTAVEARELREESGFQNVAKKISDLILELRRTRTIKLLKSSDFEPQSSISTIEVCSVAFSPKFKLYETDFGWGKPNKFEMASLGNNNISFTDTKHGDGGVEVGLVLPSHQIDVFASLFVEGLN